MGYQIFQLPKQLSFDSSAQLLSGTKAYFYATGTTTPQTVYSDSTLTTPHTFPVVADSAGVFPTIYLDQSLTYKLTLKTSADVLVYTEDPVNEADQTLTRSSIIDLLRTTTVDGYAAQYYSNRTITTTADYGFLDDSVINFSSSGVVGHASFATRVRYQAALNDDHHHDFQARSIFSSPATLNETTGFWVQSEMSSGTISDMYMFKGIDPSKSGGTITRLYGLYLTELTAGASNYAIWTAGPTPSRFGRVMAGAPLPLGSSSVSIAENDTPSLSFTSANGALNEKQFDFYADSSGQYHGRILSDDLGTTADWLLMKRSGAAVSYVSLPAATAGSFLVGTSTAAVASHLSSFVAPASTAAIVAKSVTQGTQAVSFWNAAASGDNLLVSFGTDAAYTARGTIDFNRGGTAVRYNTTSDERLKKNIQAAPDAGALIDSIHVRSFDWRENDHHVEHGFIAQELVTVAPDAVSVGDDTHNWGVDPSKLVAILVKEVQALRQRVAALEGA